MKSKTTRPRDHSHPLGCTAVSDGDVLATTVENDGRLDKVLRKTMSTLWESDRPKGSSHWIASHLCCNPTHPSVAHIIHVDKVVPVILVRIVPVDNHRPRIQHDCLDRSPHCGLRNFDSLLEMTNSSLKPRVSRGTRPVDYLRLTQWAVHICESSSRNRWIELADATQILDTNLTQRISGPVSIISLRSHHFLVRAQRKKHIR